MTKTYRPAQTAATIEAFDAAYASAPGDHIVEEIELNGLMYCAVLELEDNYEEDDDANHWPDGETRNRGDDRVYRNKPEVVGIAEIAIVTEGDWIPFTPIGKLEEEIIEYCQGEIDERDFEDTTTGHELRYAHL